MEEEETEDILDLARSKEKVQKRRDSKSKSSKL